jgi:hypothetical protein
MTALRDIINKKSDFSMLERLTEIPFTFEEEDIPILFNMAENHRIKHKDSFGYWYDYSPETQVLMALCYHKLKEKVSDEAIKSFRQCIIATNEYYHNSANDLDKINPKYNKPYDEIKKDKFRELLQLPESELIKETIKRTEGYFSYVFDTFLEFNKTDNREKRSSYASSFRNASIHLIIDLDNAVKLNKQKQ